MTDPRAKTESPGRSAAKCLRPARVSSDSIISFMRQQTYQLNVLRIRIQRGQDWQDIPPWHESLSGQDLAELDEEGVPHVKDCCLFRSAMALAQDTNQAPCSCGSKDIDDGTYLTERSDRLEQLPRDRLVKHLGIGQLEQTQARAKLEMM